MSTDHIIIFVFVVLVVVVLQRWLSEELSGLRSSVSNLFFELKRVPKELEAISDAVARLRSAVDEAALPEPERNRLREERTFEDAEPLTLNRVRLLGQGRQARLISRTQAFTASDSYLWYDRFDYRHDHISEGEPGSGKLTMHGFRRSSDDTTDSRWRFAIRGEAPEDEWVVPFAFEVTEAGASKGDEDIRRLARESEQLEEQARWNASLNRGPGPQSR